MSDLRRLLWFILCPLYPVAWVLSFLEIMTWFGFLVLGFKDIANRIQSRMGWSIDWLDSLREQNNE